MPSLDNSLRCLFCGGQAILKGRWVKARVTCRSCGMEADAKLYREQIEEWQDVLCAEWVKKQMP